MFDKNIFKIQLQEALGTMCKIVSLQGHKWYRYVHTYICKFSVQIICYLMDDVLICWWALLMVKPIRYKRHSCFYLFYMRGTLSHSGLSIAHMEGRSFFFSNKKIMRTIVRLFGSNNATWKDKTIHSLWSLSESPCN